DLLFVFESRPRMFFSEEVEISLADEAATVRQLEQFLEGLATSDEAGLAVFEVDAVRTVVQQGAQQIPFARQSGFRRFEGGHVFGNAEGADSGAVLVPQGELARQEPAGLSVLPCALFQLVDCRFAG